ncbi:MAG TPA: hypothetical protein VMR65_01445 [Candidatus Sulfotelmatobacter sp.]|nr:hypothetical protein [Candidatus Sulfotelmatobacter sp.]
MTDRPTHAGSGPVPGRDAGRSDLLESLRRRLPGLLWRDLAGMAVDPRLPAVARREAERVLEARLPELAVGARVTLARIASRGVLGALSGDPEPRVLEALARNPRCTDADIERIVARPDVPPAFLTWLTAGSERDRTTAVRLAILRHPRTPVAAALRLTERLDPHDLARIDDDPGMPRVVRVAAARRARAAGASAAPNGG